MSKAAELAALIGSQTALSNRNLIINGAFQVWQRTIAATAVGGSDVFNTADRWSFWENTDGAFTTEQSTDVPSGQGFAYSLKAACTSADTSLAAGQFSLIGHKIEAQNLSQLNYGTSNAKTMTLSFWVKSNKTGTYCFSIEKDDETDYILIKEFSVSSADTWEKKTLTITPDSNIKASAGAITNDNGLGLRLLWALALGTTYNSGSDDGTWTDSTLFGTTNQVNWMDSDSNEFYITGVQLEVGETATPFEHRSFQDELLACQRYYEKSFPYEIAPGSYGNSVHTTAFSDGNAPGTLFKVTKRAEPTIVLRGQNSATVATVDNNGGQQPASAQNITDSQVSFISVTSNPVGGSFVRYNFEAIAEL